jgi:hypothetical protein
MSAASKEGTEKRAGISAAVSVPLATLLLYAYSYSYEVGIAYAYGYPPELIQVSADLVVNAGSGLFLYALFLVGFLQLNLQMWPSTNRHVVSFVGLFAVAFLVFVGFRIWLPQHLSAAMLVSPVFAYVGQILLNRYKRGRGGKDRARKPPMIYDARSNIDEDSLAHRIVARMGFDPLLVFVAAFLVAPTLMFAAGYGEGRSNEDYLVFEDASEQYAVLRVHGGVAISAEWDADACLTKNVFIVRDLTELSELMNASCGRERD